jgi:hypothetical protein
LFFIIFSSFFHNDEKARDKFEGKRNISKPFEQFLIYEMKAGYMNGFMVCNTRITDFNYFQALRFIKYLLFYFLLSVLIPIFVFQATLIFISF